jgi:hypothetical protein
MADEYETLRAALVQVVHSGKPEGQTKLELCGGIVRGEIRVRVTIAESDHEYGGAILPGRNVSLPVQLVPSDLDWDASRPREPWLVGPNISGNDPRLRWAMQPRWIALIELLTEDVNKLCRPIERSKRTASGERNRGRKPAVREATIKAMRDDIRARKLTRDDLDKMQEKEMTNRWGGSRDTVRKARKAVLRDK